MHNMMETDMFLGYHHSGAYPTTPLHWSTSSLRAVDAVAVPGRVRAAPVPGRVRAGPKCPDWARRNEHCTQLGRSYQHRGELLSAQIYRYITINSWRDAEQTLPKNKATGT